MKSSPDDLSDWNDNLKSSPHDLHDWNDNLKISEGTLVDRIDEMKLSPGKVHVLTARQNVPAASKTIRPHCLNRRFTR